MQVQLFLSKQESYTNLGLLTFPQDDIISNNTFNEYELIKTYLAFDDSSKLLLYKCAIAIAIVGSGNGNYSKIKHDNIIYEITIVFDKLGILYNKKENEKYDEKQLTARRLVRLLKYQIQDFIAKNNRPSYLWLKYSNHDEKMIKICFPGAEHLVDNNVDALYLYNVYKNVDLRLKTKFCDKLRRVYQAKGLKINYD